MDESVAGKLIVILSLKGKESSRSFAGQDRLRMTVPSMTPEFNKCNGCEAVEFYAARKNHRRKPVDEAPPRASIKASPRTSEACNTSWSKCHVRKGVEIHFL